MKRKSGMGWLGLTVAVGMLSRAVLAAEPAVRFARNCTVYAEPTTSSTRVCQKRSGTPVTYSDIASGGFVQVETTDCAGYVFDSCLSTPEIVEQRNLRVDLRIRKDRVRFGLGLGLDGTLGTTAGTTDFSRGDGWSVSLRAQIRLSPRMYLLLAPRYQRLGLSREVNTSGALLDPNPVKFTQSVWYVGAEALVGYYVQRRFYDGQPTTDPEISLEGGLSFLVPVSAQQTSSIGSSQGISATDKPLMLFLGPSVHIAFSSVFGAVGYGHFFYNLRAAGGSKLFGGRLGVALTAAL